MPATLTAQTRDPIPHGAPTSMTIGYCRVCNRTEMVFGSGVETPRTRSVEPGPDGRYEMRPHEEWCRVWSGETPRVACPAPHCGAPVLHYEYRPGYQVTVPGAGPFGGHATYIGTDDEVSRHMHFVAQKPERAPFADKLTVQPCGHELEGGHAHEVLRQVADVRAEDARRESDQTIAKHAGLLSAAEAAGFGQVVEQYRQAVRSRSSDAGGLLAALRTLTGAAT